jgi:peroxiredoxin
MMAGWVGLAALGLVGCSQKPARPWTGSLFPEFVLPAADDTMHDSREYAGRPLLINFWATWCPPCRREMADLDALNGTLGRNGLQLLAISVDSDRNLVREYLRREGFGFTVLIDRDQQWSALALGIPGFPTTYLVGKDGIIRDAWVGPRAWADPATQAAIASRAGMD